MPSSVKTHEASDIKAARTFLYKKVTEHSRDTQNWLEQWSKFQVCNKHFIRPQDGKNLAVLSQWFRVQGVWRTEEKGEWMVRSKGDSAEELHSVERVKRICLVLCLRPVSGLWAWSMECVSAELSVESDSWNYCECSVFITNGFNCFSLSVVSIKKVIC